jgi:hypothetical protein
MGDINFNTYASGLPSASTPPVRTDQLILVQGGVARLLDIADLISTTPHLVDANVTPNFDLAGLTDAIVIKTDDSANTVTVLDSSGNLIDGLGSYVLENQRESVHLVLSGEWFKY